MLATLAYKYIKARQQTTPDGSWLLRPDVSARRMGVEGHRVMMTYLMHLHNSTASLNPTAWDDFRARYSEAKILPNQNIVRAFTDSRFTTFSWSNGLKSYTGYFAGNSPDKNKIIVPYRANNTGNLLGWYTVSGKGTNATPVTAGIYELKGNAYTMNGELNTNDNALNNRFALYSTPGNALIYLDDVRANQAATITGEYGGMLAISTDELMKLQRTLYYDGGNGTVKHKQSDGNTMLTLQSPWSNIDNELGIVGVNDKLTAFGQRGANNSIYTSKLYPMYSATQRSVAGGKTVDRRNLVYYSLVDAATTQRLHAQLQPLTSQLPSGWNGIIAADPDSTRYLLVSNFRGTANQATLSNLQVQGAAPVFEQPTTITDSKATATLHLLPNHSTGQALRFLVQGTALTAQQQGDSAIIVTANREGSVKIIVGQTTKQISLKTNETIQATLLPDGTLTVEAATMPEQQQPDAIIINPMFREGTNGWSGAPTVRCNAAEKYNTNFTVYQQLTGLQPGDYELSVQGYYRHGTTANAATGHGNGTEKLNAKLYAAGSGQQAETPLRSIIDEAGKLGTTGTNATGYGYVPNTMEDAECYFLKGLYPNTLKVTVGEDGKLTIGVKKTAAQNSDWAIFTNFQLRYMGPHDAISSIKGNEKQRKGTYTLSGTRVASLDTLPQGIFVIDGKKIVKSEN